MSDQKKTEAVSGNSKDNGQLEIQALEKKLHELEHQLQVKETVIKNLASTNEHLTLEIINLRKNQTWDSLKPRKLRQHLLVLLQMQKAQILQNQTV